MSHFTQQPAFHPRANFPNEALAGWLAGRRFGRRAGWLALDSGAKRESDAGETC